MNSRVSWSVDGIDPFLRERAEATARRAGMSLNDWLNSTIGDATPYDFPATADQSLPSHETPEVADIHQRLDAIARQIEQISRPAPRNDAPRSDAVRGEPGVARQLNDAISRLDARLSQISNPAPARQTQLQDRQRQAEMVERAAAQAYGPSPPLSPAALQSAIAEIAARQYELDHAAPRPMPPHSAPPIAPAMPPAAPPGPDFSALESHLVKITSQIEALQRPDGVEQSIAAFRAELAEIRHAITDAMPRQAIESIENEIRSLSRRIDDTRQSGIDGQALAGVERALGEIREVLRSLTPAEQLAGYDEAIRNLGAKLDLILRANDDPSTFRQLEGAIAALRSIVSNVASTDALARLTDDVRTLSAKVDQLSRPDGYGESFAILEQRIAALTSTLESRAPSDRSESSEQIEGALRALSDRLDRMPAGNDNASAFAHLEQRVSYLLERVEASDDYRSGNLGRVEEGLQDILRHLETQRSNLAALAESGRRAAETMESHGRADTEHLESALRALADRFDRMPVTASALAHLEQRVSYLLERLETSAGQRPDNLGQVEQGLQDILRHLETQHSNLAALAENGRRAAETLESHGRADKEHLESALRALADRLDRMPVGNENASALAHLEQRVSYLLERLEASAGQRPDNLGRVEEGLQDILRHLEAQRANLAALAENGRRAAETMESHGRAGASESTEQIEGALRALADRLDRMPVASDTASELAHLEQRVSYLLERLEASAGQRPDNLGRVEEGLQDILRHLEAQQAKLAALAESGRSGAGPADSGLIDVVKRELSDIRFSQLETDRHTQDSLEAVHNTLGHVVDRLAMIDGDLRAVRSQPVAPQPVMPPAPQAAPPQAAAPRVAMPPQPKPELPNPAAAQAHFAAAPREFHAAQPPAAVAAKAIGEILEPQTAPPRVTIEPELPPDHPLEPGTRPNGRVASPSERIAASESVISGIPPITPGPVSTSSFIAAARRAAQAAAAASADEIAARNSIKKPAGGKAKEPSTITSKIRSLLVGASVVVIVLGTFKMAMTLLEGAGVPQLPAMESSSGPQSSAQPPADEGAKPAMPAPAAPSMTSPTPISRQSLNGPAPSAADGTASVAIPQTPVPPPAPPTPDRDITGTTPTVQAAPIGRKLTQVQVPPTERLPDGIGGPALRAAALWGDPTAAYEIGVRFAEGKGVAPNFDEAAKWYDRAAQAGVVPALFRLGTFYEKGLSVKKDVDIARRYYMQAAERGNAKAMHNLAVLDADGGGKGANYRNASQWFRKAADRGVSDSQYNLGILYARGIGVEQNLAESFKWFSLAAAQGDADSARKRDDIVKRLDAQSLAAANLAIQTFTPEPQPDDAVNVASPSGGWDSAPVQAVPAKSAANPVSIKRAAAR
jgi:localization factor PodJL